MKTRWYGALMLGALSLSSPGWAESTVYGTFRGGWTDLDAGSAPSGFDSTDYTFSALGGMAFRAYPESASLGLEGGYGSLGRYADHDLTITALEMAAIGTVHVATGTDLFARLGASRWQADVDGGSNDDGVDVLWGAGFIYGLDALRFRGGYNRYELDDNRVDTYTLGLQYTFK
ncbi:OmpA-like transmembrane region [Alcanivorax hongdengensis A-11-3]|uniref:OmpA-like transmembrane region n=1 Tax=Alcanivorax hongdengensis A-11-3 TaxID=1177179 RepID=L0WHQ9_9GAMM|nr:outer membrane protein OmpA [Alcanivorax hongdengensis]EKF75692.1 OmpA-like transmembrane region [Alcanivorax hongdengensis A-11-3]